MVNLAAYFNLVTACLKKIVIIPSPRSEEALSKANESRLPRTNAPYVALHGTNFDESANLALQGLNFSANVMNCDPHRTLVGQ